MFSSGNMLQQLHLSIMIFIFLRPYFSYLFIYLNQVYIIIFQKNRLYSLIDTFSVGTINNEAH